ncbi:hypothetical protein [Streptomyces sp. G45]|uniref:hypothetical protein n=1 Tax=Streptomyces sp. G45 TaxID=3406627 RepID=UPI003C1CBD23
MYVAIALAHLRMRPTLPPERLGVRMWGFPWLSRATVAAMVAVIGAMAFLPDSRAQFWVSLGTVGVVLGAYEVRVRRGSGVCG